MSVFGKWFGGSAATDGDEVAISALELANLKGQLAAIDKTQAVIEFDLDGNILTANQNFLKAVGYELGEIVGRHHSIFMPPADVGGEAYRDFWRKLAGGTPQAGAALEQAVLPAPARPGAVGRGPGADGLDHRRSAAHRRAAGRVRRALCVGATVH